MIAIYGASDDLVEIEGDICEEVSPGRVITVGDKTRGVRVLFCYSPSKSSGGVWRASINQLDEGVPLFPITIVEAEPNGHPDPQSYSVKVVIDCPPGTPVTCGKRVIR